MHALDLSSGNFGDQMTVQSFIEIGLLGQSYNETDKKYENYLS